MTLDQATARLAAEAARSSDRGARRRALAALRRAARRARSSRAALEHLAGLEPHGLAAAAEWLGHDPGALPQPLWPLARRVVAAESLPPSARLAVAGRLLDALPDTAGALDSVAAPLAAGLPDAKRLARLRQLERHVEGALGLARLVEQEGRAVRLRCPRCRFAFPANGFADHLWGEHGVVWDGAKPSEAAAELGALVATAAGGGAIDAAFVGAAVFFPDSPPNQVLQAVTAQGGRDARAVAALLADALQAGQGVCRNCLAPVPDPVARPLPPANWGHGRVAGEGYEVHARDGLFGRQVVVTRPGAPPERLAAADATLPAPTRAALYAWPLALAGLAGALILPGVTPLVAAALGGLAALGVYRAVGRSGRGVGADWEAFDAAWEELTPGIGRSPAATRFLTRLCRLSVGVGRGEDRARRVRELAEQAAVLTQTKGGPEYAALFAAARVLAAADGAARGFEPVAAFRALFEPVWRGELPAGDAELLGELLRNEGALTLGDEARLGQLLAADAFAAGFTPADLSRLVGLLPTLGELLPTDALAALFALRDLPYRAAGQPAWQLAAADPAAARELLRTTPDLVLDVGFPGLSAAVTPRGLVLNGRPCDPAAEVQVGRDRRGPAVRVGPVAISLAGEPGAKAVAALRAAQALAGELLAARPPRDLSAKGRAALASLAATCPLCGERSLLRAGRLGEPVPGES